MKHIRLFEEVYVRKKDFQFEGNDLSVREKKILTDLVGKDYLKNIEVKVDDHYYYTNTSFSRRINRYNVFDNFNELKINRKTNPRIQKTGFLI